MRSNPTLLFITGGLYLSFLSSALATVPIDQIKLPMGFKIETISDKVPGARSLAHGQRNNLFIGSRSRGRVYAVTGERKVIVIASELNQPNGVAFHNGDLYVAEISRILVYKDIERDLAHPPKPKVLDLALPDKNHHGWKWIGFGPDEKLYIPIGAPCNVCENPEDERFGTISRADKNGKNFEIFARGVRNSVGLAWHPESHELWFTDNGRDWLGDDSPSDELNHAPKSGMNFGFPYCHAGTVSDPEFGKTKPCKDFIAPAQNLGPHVAALGLRFYTGTTFPKEYVHQIFVAEHGSWNRSKPIGYRISLVTLAGNKAKTYRVFAEGWLQDNGKPWGRPVDLLVHADGSLLVSDDLAGAIYRITYQQP